MCKHRAGLFVFDMKMLSFKFYGNMILHRQGCAMQNPTTLWQLDLVLVSKMLLKIISNMGHLAWGRPGKMIANIEFPLLLYSGSFTYIRPWTSLYFNIAEIILHVLHAKFCQNKYKVRSHVENNLVWFLIIIQINNIGLFIDNLRCPLR